MASIKAHLVKVLKHKPHLIGLTLDPEGWADIKDIVTLTIRKWPTADDISIPMILETAAHHPEIFEYTTNKIRVKRINKEEKTPVDPPELLYTTPLESHDITQGISKEHYTNEKYIILHFNKERAIKSARNATNIKLYKILAYELYKKGHKFYVTVNGVWLTDSDIPPNYIEEIKNEQ